MALSRTRTWNVVHAERGRLAAQLQGLEPAQWDSPSLCPGWSVHDAVAHLVDTAHQGKAGFILAMIRARGDFDRANEAGIARWRSGDSAATLARLHRAVGLRRVPPASLATRLVEAIVHGEDIRRPLGLPGDYPRQAVVDSIEYQLRTAASLGGSRERAAGLSLVAQDTGQTWGSGEPVAGDPLDLLMALCGRPVAATAFSGAGVDRLIRQSTT